jgi:hypothetical protein
VTSRICGQDADAVPLPARLRRIVLRHVPESKLKQWQASRGSFIFVEATGPC